MLSGSQNRVQIPRQADATTPGMRCRHAPSTPHTRRCIIIRMNLDQKLPRLRHRRDGVRQRQRHVDRRVLHSRELKAPHQRQSKHLPPSVPMKRKGASNKRAAASSDDDAELPTPASTTRGRGGGKGKTATPTAGAVSSDGKASKRRVAAASSDVHDGVAAVVGGDDGDNGPAGAGHAGAAAGGSSTGSNSGVFGGSVVGLPTAASLRGCAVVQSSGLWAHAWNIPCSVIPNVVLCCRGVLPWITGCGS